MSLLLFHRLSVCDLKSLDAIWPNASSLHANSVNDRVTVSGLMFPRCSQDAAMLNDAKVSTDSETGTKGVLVERSGIDVEPPGYSADSQLVTPAAAVTYVIQASSHNGIVLEADSAQSAPAREGSQVAGAAAVPVPGRKSALRKPRVAPEVMPAGVRALEAGRVTRSKRSRSGSSSRSRSCSRTGGENLKGGN